MIQKNKNERAEFLVLYCQSGTEKGNVIIETDLNGGQNDEGQQRLCITADGVKVWTAWQKRELIGWKIPSTGLFPCNLKGAISMEVGK